jgi:hypothetical protein
MIPDTHSQGHNGQSLKLTTTFISAEAWNMRPFMPTPFKAEARGFI